MSFMQEAIKQSQDIFDKCARSQFVQEIKNGTLPMEKFKAYIIQDSIYLKHYARAYGKAIYHATTLKEIQMFYAALSFVTETESAMRIDYLKQAGLSDDDVEHIAPFPECKNYVDYMVKYAERGEMSEILMAILPCMLGYHYVFKSIANDPAVKTSQYKDFIKSYVSEPFDAMCKAWCDYADKLCESLPRSKKEKLKNIFEQGNLHELYFWQMAYRGKA